MKNFLKIGRCFCIFSAIMILQTVILAADAPDAQKKKIVYEMYVEYKKDFPSVEDMTPMAAKKLMETGQVIFVDVRKPSEMEISLIPGAVTKKQFLKEPSKFHNHTVVAYCTIGARSGKFAMKMAKKGIRTYNLRGGLLAWVLEGGKVYDQKGETKRVHVYGKKWNYLPDGYEAVMFGF